MAPFPFQISPQTDDEYFMLQALKEAWKAYQEDEVPIGAVLVQGERVVARGYNQVELLKDATAHAEMLCITSAASALSNWRLTNTTLYSTVEPCSMCAGALLLSRIDRLVWGAPDHRHGANGSWTDLFALKHPTHEISITSNVLGEPSSELLKDFFKKKRDKGRKDES
jgi:tRNA(adenine34) deaminase